MNTNFLKQAKAIDTPYPGLRPFLDHESTIFFGRDSPVKEIIERLEKSSFVVVLGGSGSGKSSLIHAGLIPALRSYWLEEKGDFWIPVVFTPGTNLVSSQDSTPGEIQTPLVRLARRFADLLRPLADGENVSRQAYITEVLRGPDGLQRMVELFGPELKAPPGPRIDQANYLIVVDQFEELFHPSNKGVADCRRLVERLIDHFDRKRQRLFVVVTMRSEHLNDCATFLRLPDVINQTSYLVRRLDKVEIDAAIENPARRFLLLRLRQFENDVRLPEDYSINTDVLTRLQSDVEAIRDDPDHLPLLQHLLARIWDASVVRVSNQNLEMAGVILTADLQRAVSTITEAKCPPPILPGGNLLRLSLENWGKFLYNSRNEEERDQLDAILRQLAFRDPNTGMYTQQRLKADEAISLLGEGKTIEDIKRLLEGPGPNTSFLNPLDYLLWDDDSPDQITIKVSHESFIRGWARFRELVDFEAERFEEFVNLLKEWFGWFNNEKENNFLISGARLRRLTDLEIEKTLASTSGAKAWFKLLSLKTNGDRFLPTQSFDCTREFMMEREGKQYYFYPDNLIRFIHESLVEDQGQARKLNQLNYVASINCAQIAYKEDHRCDQDLLNQYLPTATMGEDWREFTWYYLWRAFHQETATLTGHPSAVCSVTASPDGQFLASGGGQASLILWPTETNQKPKTLEGHTKRVNSVAFSPDSKILASASGDSTIKLWSVPDGQLLHNLEDKDFGPAYSVAFSPDGKVLASGRENKIIMLWDITTKKYLEPLKGHTAIVYSVVFSRNGNMLVSGSQDETIRFWDTVTWKELDHPLDWSDSKGKGVIYTVALSPDDKLLAAAGWDESIKIWNFETRTEINELKHFVSTVRAVAFSPDSQFIAGGSWDQTIKIWSMLQQDGQDPDPLSVFNGHADVVQSVTFSHDGQYLFSASDDQTVKKWVVSTSPEREVLEGHKDSVYTVSISPNCQILASGGADNTVILWNLVTRDILHTLEKHEDNVESLAFSPDGKFLASGSKDATVRLWTIPDGEKFAVGKFKGHVLSVAFSSYKQCLAVAIDESNIVLIDLASRPVLDYPIVNMLDLVSLQVFDHPIIHTNDKICRVAFSPDGRILATGGREGTIKLWDVATWKELEPLSGDRHWADVWSFAFSNNGKFLASASWDRKVKLWDLSSYRLIKTLSRHLNSVVSVAFSPDDKTLATGSWDKTIKLWHVGTLKEIATFKEHGDERVTSVAFSQDGKMLVSSGNDRIVRLWCAANREVI